MARRLEFETISALLFGDTFGPALTRRAAETAACGCGWRVAKDYSSCDDLALSRACLPLLTPLLCAHHQLFNSLSFCAVGLNFNRGIQFFWGVVVVVLLSYVHSHLIKHSFQSLKPRVSVLRFSLLDQSAVY